MEKFTDFLDAHLLNIAIILFITYIFRKFAMVVVTRLVRRGIRGNRFKTDHDERQREDTLVSTIGAALRVSIWVVAGLLLLSELGLNLAPLLAGAGILGVALGFGAQSLVKDFLAGTFIIIENQYRVGDVVQVNQGVAGIVEHLTLRETVLRDLDGMVHHIPNGNIELATNMTMEYANVNLNIRVDYSSDLDKVEEVINKVGQELADDETWKLNIIEPPAFMRVDALDESAIIIKIVGKTAPMQQWAITGELRKRLVKAFHKAGIVMPFPQRAIHQTDSKSK